MRKLVITTLLMVFAASSLQAATPLEKLRSRLEKFQKKGIMIGHQDDPLYGTKWHFDEGRSDVKEDCGDYPAVMGFELGNIELDSLKNLDGVPFDRMKMEIIAHHLRGGIVTISWHANNTVTRSSRSGSTVSPYSSHRSRPVVVRPCPSSSVPGTR